MTGLGLSRSSVGRSGWQRFSSRFDWPLFGVIVAIAAIGLLNLYSALTGTRHEALFAKQIAWMTVGFSLFLGLTALDYRVWQRFAWFALGAAILAIGAVDIIGISVKGARRWIGMGGFSIQPSEVAKIAVILAVARLAQDHEAAELQPPELGLRLGLLSVPVLLVLLQPDLGSASLTLLIMLSVAFLVMRRVWILAAAAGLGLAALPLFWEHMHAYQKARVMAFLDPSVDPNGIGWHTRQSIMAVGSGRITGEGFMNGTQNQFKFLPEHWTDFPFSVFAEEWGFAGCLVVLALFVFLILWVLNAALNARDTFGGTLCLGVAAMLFWHTVVNTAMVLGLAPVVGVTLPLISYGGSSVLTVFVGLGLVSSVSARRHGY